MTENEIREMLKEKGIDKVDWKCILFSQTLSEDFIREFKDVVNWYYISEYQKLSKEFIIEFKDKIDCPFIFKIYNKEFIK